MKTGFKILISVGTGLACFLFSIFSQLLLLPFLALAAFMAAEWSPLFMLPALIGAAAGTLAFSSFGAGSIAAAAAYVLLAIFLAVSLGKKFPHRYTALGAAVILTLGMYLSITLDPIIAGEPPYADAVKIWNEVMLDPISSVFGADPAYASFIDALTEFGDYIPDVIMPSCIASGCGSALVLTVIPRLFYKLFRIEPRRKMANFIDWRLPQTALWGSLIILFVIPVAFVFRFERAAAITASAAIIVVGMFSVQGLAYLSFVLSVAEAPLGVRVMPFILAALFFPYSTGILTVFGVKEQIKNDRRLMRRIKEDNDSMKKAERRSDEINKYGYSRDDDPEDNDDEKNGPKEDA